MKIQATFALLLILAMSFVRFCPACDQATLSQQAASQRASQPEPMAGHACCQKSTAPDTEPVPASENPDSEDCAREHLSAILRAAVAETAAEALAVSSVDAALVVLPMMTEPSIEEPLAASAVTDASSPPIPLMALPIRI